VVFAHAEAERHYHTALELARETGRRPQEAEALHKLGRVLTDVGRYEEAREALTGAARLYRELSDQPGEVWATVQLGSVHRALGTSGAGITQVRALLTRLETGGRPQDITELYIVLETLHYATGHYREGLAAADRASELAQSTAEGAALARAETGRGTELLMLGRLDEGLRALEGAIVLGEASDDPYNLARALDNAAAGYRSRGNPGRSREIVERLLALQEPLQNPWGLAIALSGVGATYRQLGDWARARTYLEQGEQLRRALPPSLWAIYLLLELAALNLDEGRRGLGSEQVEEALSLARRSGHLEGIRAGEHALAELDLFEGRPELARERLEPLLDRSGLEELQVTEMLPTLAAAYAASGANPRLVDEAIQAAVRRATASNSMRSLASALLVRGRVLAARGQRTAAVCDLEESVRLARNMPYPYLEARGLFEWGLTCGKQGKPEKARERLEEALETFQRLGARPYVERTERVRDEIGPA
jgi:tetratricopeptide (TPR) repeat protein